MTFSYIYHGHNRTQLAVLSRNVGICDTNQKVAKRGGAEVITNLVVLRTGFFPSLANCGLTEEFYTYLIPSPVMPISNRVECYEYLQHNYVNLKYKFKSFPIPYTNRDHTYPAITSYHTVYITF